MSITEGQHQAKAMLVMHSLGNAPSRFLVNSGLANSPTDTLEGGQQEEGELVEVVPEPTHEELLTQLGLQLEQKMAHLTATDELPAGIVQQWAEEELRRDWEQWQPKRELADEDSEDEEDAAQAVSFSDIKSSILGPCKPPTFPFIPSPPSPRTHLVHEGQELGNPKNY